MDYMWFYFAAGSWEIK